MITHLIVRFAIHDDQLAKLLWQRFHFSSPHR